MGDKIRAWLSDFAKKHKENKSRDNKLIMIVITIVAVLVFLAGINKQHLSPLSTTLELDGATRNSSLTAELSGGDANNAASCSAIVDSRNQRLLILNGDGKLINLVDMSKSGSPMDEISSVTVDGDDIYVSGYKLYNYGEYLTSETIVRYGKDGKLKETIFSHDYSIDEYNTEPRIKQIIISDGKLYILAAIGNIAYVLTTEQGFDNPLLQTDIGEHVQHMLAYSSGSNANKGQNADSIIIVGRSTMTYTVEAATGRMMYEYKDDIVKNLEKASVKEVKYSGGYFFRNIVHWLAIAWLGVIALVFVIYLIFFKLDKNSHRLLFVVVAGLLLVSVYYSVNITKEAEKGYERCITTMAKQFSRITNSGVESDIEDKLKNEGVRNYCTNPENAQQIEAMQQKTKDICKDFGSEESCYVQSFLFEGDKTYTFVGSSNRYCVGMDINWADETKEMIKNFGKDGAIKIENSVSERIVCCEPIYDSSGNAIGFFEVGFKEGNLKKSESNTRTDLFINLLAIFIVICIGYLALKDVFADVGSYRNNKKLGVKGAEAYLTSSFNMLYKFCTAMDMVILVYVAQSLCADMPPVQQAAMVALPATVNSIGVMVGKWLCPGFFRKFGYRKTAIMSCILTACTYLVTVFALGINSIYIFTACKGVQGFFAGGVLFMAMDSIPYAAGDEKTRNTAIASSQQTATAAGILTAIINGYVSQYLSYSAIYLIAAVFAAGMVFLCIPAFKKENEGEEISDEELQAAGKAASKAAWSTMLKPAMLVYIIGYMIPTMLYSGYSGYLFPLYTAGAGVSALLLSNISAFSKTVNYLTFDPIQRFAKQFNQTAVMLFTLTINAVCMLCFLLSPNIYWAIAVFFIFAITQGLYTLGSKIYVNNVAEEYEVDMDCLRNDVNQVNSVIFAFKSPILSAFVGLGMNLACAAVGAVAAVFTAIFGIYNKRRKS